MPEESFNHTDEDIICIEHLFRVDEKIAGESFAEIDLPRPLVTEGKIQIRRLPIRGVAAGGIHFIGDFRIRMRGFSSLLAGESIGSNYRWH